jgi:hypothetical protein
LKIQNPAVFPLPPSLSTIHFLPYINTHNFGHIHPKELNFDKLLSTGSIREDKKNFGDAWTILSLTDMLLKILEKIYYLIYIRQLVYRVDLEECRFLILIHHYICPFRKSLFISENTILLCHLAVGPEI